MTELKKAYIVRQTDGRRTVADEIEKVYFPEEWVVAMEFAKLIQKDIELGPKETIEVFNTLIVYGFHSK